MAQQRSIDIPISFGELFDKLTILEIKRRRINDAEKRAHVEHEWKLLGAVRDREAPLTDDAESLVRELREVNEQLWDAEDEIRGCEGRGDFGPRFIELARSIYRINDRRSEIKRKLNELFRSAIVEAKSYA